MCIRGTLDKQIARIHRPAIPLQPEAEMLRTYTIFRQRIGPQIIPLFTYSVALLAYCSCIPPAAQFMSCIHTCNQCSSGKDTIVSGSVPDTL